jgi:hypothetical protein
MSVLCRKKASTLSGDRGVSIIGLEVRNRLTGRRTNGWNVLGLGRSVDDGLLFRLWEQIGMNDGCVSDLVLYILS